MHAAQIIKGRVCSIAVCSCKRTLELKLLLCMASGRVCMHLCALLFELLHVLIQIYLMNYKITNIYGYTTRSVRIATTQLSPLAIIGAYQLYKHLNKILCGVAGRGQLQSLFRGRVLADYARISSRYERIRHRALYSDLKLRIYNFDAYCLHMLSRKRIVT